MDDFYIHVDGETVPATPRFWKWMQSMTLYRGGEAQAWSQLKLPDDSGFVGMHLLAYYAIKYPEPQLVGSHRSALGGRIFGRIDIKCEDGEGYLIYKSARTGEQEQVFIVCGKTGERFCSLRAMNTFTKKLTQPQIIKDGVSACADKIAATRVAAHPVVKGGPRGHVAPPGALGTAVTVPELSKGKPLAGRHVPLPPPDDWIYGGLDDMLW